MKKVILLFSMVALVAINVWAESVGGSNSGSDTGVFMDYYIKGKGGSSAQVNRSLVVIPSIKVSYDSETNTIYFFSSADSVVKIVVYNEEGNILTSTNSSLNGSIQLNMHIPYRLYIEQSEWYGVGFIE